MALNLPSSPPNTAAYVNSAVNSELTTNWFPLAGVTNGGNASAGNIGEYISSSVAYASALSATTGVVLNVTSISLTAGDWDVWGSVGDAPAGGTTPTSTDGWISTTSATYPASAPNGGAEAFCRYTRSAGAIALFSIGMTRMSISSTTTVYLSGVSIFSGGSSALYGFIGARRVR
jgi:hypothetical protein